MFQFGRRAPLLAAVNGCSREGKYLNWDDRISCKKKIVFDPGEMAKFYHRRALASKRMGKTARAVEEVRKALCLDPKNTKMKANLEWKS